MSATAETVGLRLRRSAAQLHATLRRVLDEVPVGSGRPQDYARKLNLHSTLAGRLVGALRVDDPLASLIRMPRAEGLRMFLDAARTSADPDSLSQAADAVRHLDELVRGDLGGWDALTAAISTWLPEERERFELANRQTVYRGMCNLAGARCDVRLVTVIYHPAPGGDRCDIAVLMGLLGLRRIQPGARIPIASMGAHPNDPKAFALNFEPLPGEPTGDRYPLLAPYCSEPLPQLHCIEAGGIREYQLVGDEIGVRSEVDLVSASVVRQARPRFRSPGDHRQRVSVSAGVSVPARLCLFNVLVHEDVWPGVEPTLAVYNNHLRGAASPNDPARDIDRVETSDAIQPLGRGLGRCRAAEVGRHVEMIQDACTRLAWNPEHLRGYRCRVPYPLTHHQYCMVFDPPAASGDATGG